jgi:hypothetical protein
MLAKIQLIAFGVLLIALSICITVIVSMSFALKEKQQTFDYGKIDNMIKIDNQIDIKFDRLSKLTGKDYQNLLPESKPFFNNGWDKKNYPIIINKIDYDKLTVLNLCEYIEKEHAQIYQYCNYIIEK